MLQIILLLPAIACLIIAIPNHNYLAETSCTGSYTIDLYTFLAVAGGLQHGFGTISLCCTVRSWNKEDNDISAGGGLACCGCCVELFYLVWAAIGMSMWGQETDSACRSESIAQIVLGWRDGLLTGLL